jgi:hypothetical protein
VCSVIAFSGDHVAPLIDAGQSLVASTALLSSKAFVDFSTSGLENPLTHVPVLAARGETVN